MVYLVEDEKEYESAENGFHKIDGLEDHKLIHLFVLFVG